MANNYSAATVEPFIPARLLRGHLGKVLDAAGFSRDERGGMVYLYAPDGINDYDMDDCEIDWAGALQEAAQVGGIPEIVVQGAYWCDKCRPNEFGGFVTRITPGSTQHGNTDSLLRSMREEIK